VQAAQRPGRAEFGDDTDEPALSTWLAGTGPGTIFEWLGMGGDIVAPLYKGYRFPAEVIAHCVWLYHRFTLSFREVEELMLARGVSACSAQMHLPVAV
jgi:hypothetical protein